MSVSTNSKQKTEVTSSASQPAEPQPQLSFLSAVELQVFHTAVTNYKTHGQFLRDDAIALKWVFGTQVFAMLELLDEECVTVMKSPSSGKVLIQVYGRNEAYWVPPGSSICQCVAYIRGKRSYCKHVLAAHFYLAIASPDEYEDISERELFSLYEDHFKKPVHINSR